MRVKARPIPYPNMLTAEVVISESPKKSPKYYQAQVSISFCEPRIVQTQNL